MRRLKRGRRICINLTYKCSLDCDYCAEKMVQGKIPAFSIHSGREWIEFIEKLPNVKEVLLSGGVPEYHPDFIFIVETLLVRQYFVMIYTNLVLYDKLNKLPKSNRLLIAATYHRAFNIKLFDNNYQRLKKKYRVHVDEIGIKLLPYSKLKPFIKNNEELKTDKSTPRISPNMNIYTNCYDLYYENISNNSNI